MRKNFMFLLVIVFLCCEWCDKGVYACEDRGKIYFEFEDVECDEGGYFIESREMRIGKHAWQCPYCSNWWPLGKRCRNSICPSNYGNSSNEFGYDFEYIDFEWE